MIIQLFLVVLIVAFLIAILKMLMFRQKLPPGPFPLPLVGNVFHLDPARPYVSFQKLAKIHGPVFTVWFGHQPAIVITDYEIMKDALTKHGDQLSSRPKVFTFEYFSGGNFGIVLSSGDLWKEQRRFSLQIMRNFGMGRNLMEERILIEARKLSQVIIQEMAGNNEAKLNLDHFLHLCVSNVIAQILFGKAFDKDDKKYQRLQKCVDESFKVFSRPTVHMVNAFPWLRHVPLFGHFGFDDMSRGEKIMRDFLLEQLDEHKENLAKFDDEKEPNDFIDAYLQEMQRRKRNGEDLSYFSDWQLKCILGDVFTAGMETSVTTLRWALLAMIKFPEVQQKVHEEIDSVLDRDKSPNMADRKSMPYVMAVINEVQRWGNIIPINLFHTNDSDFTLAGYKIPKDIMVIPQISCLAVDETIFPYPEKFLPERFLEADGKSVVKIEQFVPFSLGKRQCLGEGLAKAELFLIFVHLMQRFQFSIPPGDKTPSDEPVPGFTLAPHPYDCLVMIR